MADTIDSARRSWNMSRIKSKDTALELRVRQFLFHKGVRYRIHPNLRGRPDIAIAKLKLIIFINGCFWHGHTPCPVFRLPKTNTAFWRAKIETNVRRDALNAAKLTDGGWKVIEVWECEIEREFEATMEKLLKYIANK